MIPPRFIFGEGKALKEETDICEYLLHDGIQCINQHDDVQTCFALPHPSKHHPPNGGLLLTHQVDELMHVLGQNMAG